MKDFIAELESARRSLGSVTASHTSSTSAG